MRTIPLILNILILCTIISCKPKEEEYGNKLGDIESKADPVRTEGELVQVGDFPLELISNGKLQAYQRASVFFRQNELITDINVENGQWVEKGTLLAILDTADVALAFEQARVTLERSKLDLRSLVISYNGGSEDMSTVDPKTLESYKLKSGMTAAEVSLKQQELKYKQCFLHAPISGRVVGLTSKPYNLPVTSDPFCVIVDDRDFEVMFPIFETEISRVKVGQEVTVRPFSNDSLVFNGKITEINPMVGDHGKVQVKARIPNRNNQLFEGMNMKVYTHFNVPGGMIIPKEALVLRNNRQVVFSLKDGRSYWNYVITGYENSSSYTIEIETGVLQPGDTIITKGNLNLSHDAELDFTFIDHNEQ